MFDILKDDLIEKLYDKISNNNKDAFIGCGIKDYEVFFESLEKNKTLIKNEKQVSNGFSALIKELNPIYFTWYDIGNIDGYVKIKNKFANSKDTFNFEKR